MNPKEEPIHPIQVVARRTGLSMDTLRAWERRYRAISPARSSTGRRLYSDENVERLLLLNRATLDGRSIGQIAALPTEELRRLVASDEEAQGRLTRLSEGGSPARIEEEVAGTSTPASHLESCWRAVQDSEPRALRTALAHAARALSRPALVEEVLAPLLVRVGDSWHAGELSVAQEHLASAALRSFLGGMLDATPGREGAPILLVTTPAGQQHEFGALASAVLAAGLGWDVLYAGPNLPVGEIAHLAIARGARLVTLGLTYPPDDPKLGDEIRRLASLLTGRATVVVGGQAAATSADALLAAGVRIAADLPAFRALLGEIR